MVTTGVKFGFMNLHAFMQPLSHAEKVALAARCDTSLNYLQQIALKFKRASVGESGNVARICAATGWKVTPHDLRPDVYRTPVDGMSLRRRGR